MTPYSTAAQFSFLFPTLVANRLFAGNSYRGKCIYAGCLTKLHGGAYASPCYELAHDSARLSLSARNKKKKKCAGSVIVLCCCCCMCVFPFFIIFPVSFIHTLCVCVHRGCASFGQDRKGRQRETLVGFCCFSFPPVFLFYFISFQKGGELGEVAAAVLAHQRLYTGCIISKCVHACGCVCVCVGRVCVYMWRERERVYLWFCYTGCAQCINALPH